MVFLSKVENRGTSEGVALEYVQKKDKKMLTATSSFEILRPHTEKHNTSHMRTKTLLLTAALAAAGAATSMAQSTIYSVNAVGYANITINNGFNLIADPFTKVTDRTAGALLGAPPSDVDIIKLRDDGAFETDSWSVADGFWSNSGDGTTAMTIDEGKGIIVRNAGGAFNVTFVGEVQQGTAAQGNQVQNPVTPGIIVRSSKIPQGAPNGLLSDNLGLVPSVGVTVTTYHVGGGFDTFTYDPTIGGSNDDNWNSNQPNLRIGQAFFIQSPGTSWNRDFTVN
jgi:hypothetical protein